MSVQFHPKVMNQTLTSFDKVSTSTALQKFSFSKDSRFKDVKLEHHKIGYKLPSSFDPKADKGVGFGYGDREIYRRGSGGSSNTPSPDRYEVGSFIDKYNFGKSQNSSQLKSFLQQKGNATTFCFGAGRENFNRSVYNSKLSKLYPDPIVPGPGTYEDLTRNIGVNARKHSCHGRLEGFDDGSISKKRAIPGPGTYEDQTRLDPIGKYAFSTYNNSKASNFNTGRRFKSPQSGLATPGPGTYEAVGETAASRQGASNFHSILTRTFRTTEKQRPDVTRFKTPGPGSYRPPSDFGYMDGVMSPMAVTHAVNTPFLKDKNGTSMTDFDRTTRKNSVGLRATPGVTDKHQTLPNGVFSIRLTDQKDRTRGTSQLMHTIGGQTPAVHRLPAFASSSSNSKIMNNRSGRLTNQATTDAQVKQILRMKDIDYKPVTGDPLSPRGFQANTTQAYTSAADESSPLMTMSQWQVQSMSQKSSAGGPTSPKKVRRQDSYKHRLETVKQVYTTNNNNLGQHQNQRKRKSSRKRSSSLGGRSCSGSSNKSNRSRSPGFIVPYQTHIQKTQPQKMNTMDIEKARSVPFTPNKAS